METLILILCFNPLYREIPQEFCMLTTRPNTENVREYCADRGTWSPEYDMTVCREFDGSTHDKELLK